MLVGIFIMKEIIPHWKNKSIDNLTEIIDGVTYTEEWKPIDKFEGIYSISNFGRVISHSRVMNVCGEQRYCKIEKIRTQSKTQKGYLSVKLHNSTLKKSMVVHRLVGFAFIPNPNNLPEVNHMKGIKTDNRAHQLEWMTHLDNCQHAFREGIATISDKQRKAVGDKNRLYCGGKHYMAKLVLNLQTGIFYDTVAEASKSIGMPASTLYEKLNGRKRNNSKFIYA